MDEDGIAHLQPDSTSPPTGKVEPPRSLKNALDAAAGSRGDSSSDAGTESQSEEDYDALRHDPNAIVVGGKGGGFAEEANGKGAVKQHVEKSFEEIKSASKSRPKASRLKSIPITLNRLQEEGRYILTADDDALKEILRIGIERVGVSVGIMSDFLLTGNRRRIPPQANGEVNLVTWFSLAASQHLTDKMLNLPTRHSMDFSPSFGWELLSIWFRLLPGITRNMKTRLVRTSLWTSCSTEKLW